MVALEVNETIVFHKELLVEFFISLLQGVKWRCFTTNLLHWECYKNKMWRVSVRQWGDHNSYKNAGWSKSLKQWHDWEYWWGKRNKILRMSLWLGERTRVHSYWGQGATPFLLSSGVWQIWYSLMINKTSNTSRKSCRHVLQMEWSNCLISGSDYCKLSTIYFNKTVDRLMIHSFISKHFLTCPPSFLPAQIRVSSVFISFSHFSWETSGTICKMCIYMYIFISNHCWILKNHLWKTEVWLQCNIYYYSGV